MMYIRQSIIAASPFVLSLSTTFALRYSHVRTQFKPNKKSAVERPIIDYTLQKNKIYPIIAKMYAINCNYMFLNDMVKQNAENVKNNDFGLMKEIHILMCMMKAFATQSGNQANFDLMQACGGHGFLNASGFAKFIDGGFPNVI